MAEFDGDGLSTAQIEVCWHDPRNDADRERRTEVVEGRCCDPPRRQQPQPGFWRGIMECLKWRRR